MKWFLPLFALLATPLFAAEWDVPARAGAISETLSRAQPGDTLRLAPGTFAETVVLDFPIVLDGAGEAIIDGGGVGTVITVNGDDVTLRGLTVIGSGSDHSELDSGIKLTKTASNPVVINNVLQGNLYGVDIHGATDALVADNVIEGRQDLHMNDRGNGVYLWSAPGAVVERNDIRWGRDGIFVFLR